MNGRTGDHRRVVKTPTRPRAVERDENVRRHAPRRSPSRPVSAARNSPHDDPSKKIKRAKNKKSLYCCYVRRCERFSVLEPRAEGDEGEIERPRRSSLAGSDPNKKNIFSFLKFLSIDGHARRRKYIRGRFLLRKSTVVFR
jgi:hypothetical protein